MTLPAAVLWDMDGTLVDTEPYWIAAEHAIVEEHGGTWNDEFAHQLVGNDLMVSAEFIRDNSPITWSPERIIHELLDRVIAQVEEHVPWRPGALDLLEDLAQHEVPTALVTMSWRSLADAVLEGLPGAGFTALVTGDEVAHGKPHPEPYIAACRMLEVSPAYCVAIEDSPTGVRSAVAAGVPTLAVPHVVPVPVQRGAVQAASLQGIRAHDLTGLFAGHSFTD
jgi:HAD superfamily hydrolase (TIGR01509 family)